jgi:hypothetical protein
MKKKNFPVDKVRRFLEPGPIILISSAHKGERDSHGPKPDKFDTSGRSVSYRRRFKRVNL